MEKRFEIQGVSYVCRFDRDNNCFEFYIDGDASPANIQPARDALWANNWNSKIYTKTETRDFFLIKKEVLGFVDSVLKSLRPYYFSYSANEAIKQSLYRKMAGRIAQKYGYGFIEDPAGVFRFFQA